jgi:hypothetical protein
MEKYFLLDTDIVSYCGDERSSHYPSVIHHLKKLSPIEPLAKPQVSPGAIHIQPLRGCPRLISSSSGRDCTGAKGH